MQAIVAEMAEEKAAHVGFLRDVLEDAAPPCPAMDIGPAFAAAADAATGEVLIPPFSPYDDDTLFLHAAFLLQDVFATVYAGVATDEPKPGAQPPGEPRRRRRDVSPCGGAGRRVRDRCVR